MEKITVSRIDLLTTLEDNREKHLAQYTKAIKGYRKKVIKTLEKQLKDARDGGKIDLRALGMFPEPRNYVAEYDTAIAMVEWAQGDSIEIDQESFRNFVQDEWGWKNSFLAGTQQYLGGN